MTHDLTVRQREELKELIKEANEKEQQDETGSFMYRVRGPPHTHTKEKDRMQKL